MSLQAAGGATGRLRVLVIALIATLAGLAVAVPAQGEAKKSEQSPPFEVMTRNVYLGADLGPALGAPNIGAAIDGAGEIYNEIQRTNFPERAKPLAEELLKQKPDLVGLQEVAHWRVQNPSDGGGPPISPFGVLATETEFDFLAELMNLLGDEYEVIAVQDEFEGELPADIDGDNSTGTGPLGAGVFGADLDARLTMRDVILARKHSRVSALEDTVDMAQFDTAFTANIGGVLVTADRGWLSVEAEVTPQKGSPSGAQQGKGQEPFRFRFVNTHLEAFGDPTIREAQAKELFAPGGPLQSTEPVVLVGDLNSGLEDPHRIFGGDQLAFQALLGFGMKDYGAVQSCCYPSALNDPSFTFDHTVDHVMVKPDAKLLNSGVTGDDPAEITPSGLWPSDHGGVWSKLKLLK